MSNQTHQLPPNDLELVLPGPTRKRTSSPYQFHLVYRNADPGDRGCALLWEVHGGRMEYQVALERQDRGEMAWHCTCADAVYRGADQPHQCKHVKALVALGRSSGAATHS